MLANPRDGSDNIGVQVMRTRGREPGERACYSL
jgi:hypothetical protein